MGGLGDKGALMRDERFTFVGQAICCFAEMMAVSTF